MSRDPWKLKVFALADELVVAVYKITRNHAKLSCRGEIWPPGSDSPSGSLGDGEPRRGLRPSTLRDYLHFIGFATASASEVRYLSDLTRRLEFLDGREAENLGARFGDLIRGLQTLIVSLERRA